MTRVLVLGDLVFCCPFPRGVRGDFPFAGVPVLACLPLVGVLVFVTFSLGDFVLYNNRESQIFKQCLDTCTYHLHCTSKCMFLLHVQATCMYLYMSGWVLPMSHPPDIIHVMNAPRPSPFLIAWSSAPAYYCVHKPKIKMGGGLGTRLHDTHNSAENCQVAK